MLELGFSCIWMGKPLVTLVKVKMEPHKPAARFLCMKTVVYWIDTEKAVIEVLIAHHGN